MLIIRRIPLTPNLISGASVAVLSFAIATSGTFVIQKSIRLNTVQQAINFSRKWEGGNVDHPNDPGGRTGVGGITQPVYNAYRVKKGKPIQDVFRISDSEVQEIYIQYLKKFGCDKYLQPMLTACLDTSLNFNPQGAKDFMSALPANPVQAALVVAARRKAYRYQRVKEKPSQNQFLQGWLNRDYDLAKFAQTYRGS